jgi:hypothetical protein
MTQAARRLDRQDPQARIAELEDEVAWLRSELGLQLLDERAARLAAAFRLSVQEARALEALAAMKPGRHLSGRLLLERITDGLDDRRAEDPGKQPQVLVWRLRRRLGRDAVINLHGFGYRLSDAARARVQAVFDAMPASPRGPHD